MTGPVAWWQAWWAARRRPVERWTLSQRNVYILPTRAGLAFALTLVLLLVASINFQLNLGYALTFLLAGSALASMHMAHASLRGLSLHLRAAAPSFVGQATRLELLVDNPGATRHGLGFSVRGAPADQRSWSRIEAQAQTSVVLTRRAARRGHHGLPMLSVESRFPFGLFRAWTQWQPAGHCWVYPTPEPNAPPLPAAATQPGDTPSARRAAPGEFEGVRPWRRGDSLRQIAWKKVAGIGQLISRDGEERLSHELWLDWRQTGLADPEARWSRLAAWVLAADAAGLTYGLRLPDRELPCEAGPAQRERALQALALQP